MAGMSAPVSMLPLPCIGCGYDVRGLPANRKCPECGREIWRSLDRGRLMYVDRRWLTRIVWGQWLLRRSLGFLFALVMLGAVGFAVLIISYRNSMPPVWFDLGFIIWIILFYSGLLGASAAAILSAEPDPRERERDFEWPDVRRLVARWGFLVCVMLLFVLQSRVLALAVGIFAELAIAFVLIPLWVISASLLVSRLARLAPRVARENVGDQLAELLAGQANLLMVIAWALIVMEVVLVLSIALPGVTIDFISAVLQFLFVTLLIPVIVLLCGGLIALRDLHLELQRCLARARSMQ